jgi:hypothetical protein
MLGTVLQQALHTHHLSLTFLPLAAPHPRSAGNRYHQLTYNVPLAQGLLGAVQCDATGAVPSNLLSALIAAPVL